MKGSFMIKKTKLAGAVLAITAASVFALTPVTAVAMGKHPKVNCSGIKGAKGVVKMSKKMCERKGGTVVQNDDQPKSK